MLPAPRFLLFIIATAVTRNQQPATRYGTHRVPLRLPAPRSPLQTKPEGGDKIGTSYRPWSTEGQQETWHG